MSGPAQRTGCTAIVGTHEGGTWDGHPIVCGRDAAGPHPDPERGYREPLCRWHLAAFKDAKP